eukprot:EG_transcript_23744
MVSQEGSDREAFVWYDSHVSSWFGSRHSCKWDGTGHKGWAAGPGAMCQPPKGPTTQPLRGMRGIKVFSPRPKTAGAFHVFGPQHLCGDESRRLPEGSGRGLAGVGSRSCGGLADLVAQ